MRSNLTCPCGSICHIRAVWSTEPEASFVPMQFHATECTYWGKNKKHPFHNWSRKLKRGLFSTQTKGFKHKRHESDELWTRLPWMRKREQKGTFFLWPEYSRLWRFLNGICSSMVEATNLGSTFLKLE